MLEDNVTREREREYYERALRLREEILKKPDILESIRSIFRHVYENPVEYRFQRENLLRKGTFFLGSGEATEVYSVCTTKITDPLNKRKIYLALRLKKDVPFGLANYEIAGMERAFIDGENTPYFCCAVYWKKYGAVITEDVSERKKYAIEEQGYEKVKRISSNGKKEVFFVDPMCLDPRRGEKYLEDIARIDIPE